MSGNIKDTNVHNIKQDLESLLKELDNIIKKKESPNDYLYNLEKKYKDLKQTSPKLFEFTIKEYQKPTFDKEQFLKNINMMLDTILNIQNSKISQYDASVKVGSSLAYQYIPQLKKK
jgi:DNA polymerase III gamma/tau subunit